MTRPLSGLSVPGPLGPESPIKSPVGAVRAGQQRAAVLGARRARAAGRLLVARCSRWTAAEGGREPRGGGSSLVPRPSGRRRVATGVVRGSPTSVVKRPHLLDQTGSGGSR